MCFLSAEKYTHPLAALQVSKEYTALLKTDATAHLEIQVSPENRAGRAARGIKDPQESATQQPARAQCLTGNHPTLKTIKHRRLRLLNTLLHPKERRTNDFFFFFYLGEG